MHGQKTWTIKLTKQKRDKKKEEKWHVIGTQICLIKSDCKEYGSCRGRGLMGLLMAMVAQSDEEGVGGSAQRQGFLDGDLVRCCITAVTAHSRLVGPPRSAQGTCDGLHVVLY